MSTLRSHIANEGPVTFRYSMQLGSNCLYTARIAGLSKRLVQLVVR